MPTEERDSGARFERFLEALRTLCIEHGVQLAPSLYDSLQVYELNPHNGEDPLHFPSVDNRLEGDTD